MLPTVIMIRGSSLISILIVVISVIGIVVGLILCVVVRKRMVI